MTISEDYKESVGYAAKVISNHKAVNHVMAANDIIGGCLSEKGVLVGKFVLETTDENGETLCKSANDLAAAIMTEISWNTRNPIVIWHEKDDKRKFVLEN